MNSASQEAFISPLTLQQLHATFILYVINIIAVGTLRFVPSREIYIFVRICGNLIEENNNRHHVFRKAENPKQVSCAGDIRLTDGLLKSHPICDNIIQVYTPVAVFCHFKSFVMVWNQYLNTNDGRNLNSFIQ